MHEEYAALSLSCNYYYVKYKDGNATRRDLFNIPYIVPLSFLFFSEDFLANSLDTSEPESRTHIMFSKYTHIRAHIHISTPTCTYHDYIFICINHNRNFFSYTIALNHYIYIFIFLFLFIYIYIYIYIYRLYGMKPPYTPYTFASYSISKIFSFLCVHRV